jgi:hypothetical protein
VRTGLWKRTNWTRWRCSPCLRVVAPLRRHPRQRSTTCHVTSRRIRSGDVRAILTVVRVMERRAKLVGSLGWRSGTDFSPSLNHR